MSTGYTKSKKYELQNDLNAIAEIPERVTEFSKVRLKEILEYLKSELEYRIKQADNTASANFEKYKYPNEYLPNKELEYWLERTYQFGFNYYDLKHYQKFINNHLNSITIHDPVFKNPTSQLFFETLFYKFINTDNKPKTAVQYIFRLLYDEPYKTKFQIIGTRLDFATFYNTFLIGKVPKEKIKDFDISINLNEPSIKELYRLGYLDKREEKFNSLLLDFERSNNIVE